MKMEKEDVRNFYQNLGKLFYAIAAADKRVKTVELEKLIELLEKRWLNADCCENVDSYEAQLVRTFFERLDTAKSDAEKYFLEFINFKKQHPKLFTKDIRKSIMKTDSAIAYSFSGLNKSELIMLAKLNLELKK